jgi:hypothetical protein
MQTQYGHKFTATLSAVALVVLSLAMLKVHAAPPAAGGISGTMAFHGRSLALPASDSLDEILTLVRGQEVFRCDPGGTCDNILHAPSNRKMQIPKLIRWFSLVAVLLFLSSLPAFSQGCALCYTQAAASGARSIAALRSGILVPAIPDVYVGWYDDRGLPEAQSIPSIRR